MNAFYHVFKRVFLFFTHFNVFKQIPALFCIGLQLSQLTDQEAVSFVSDTSRNSVKIAERIELVFGVEDFFDYCYTV